MSYDPELQDEIGCEETEFYEDGGLYEDEDEDEDEDQFYPIIYHDLSTSAYLNPSTLPFEHDLL